MKLTYWYSRCPDDGDVYSIRTQTKRAAIDRINDSEYSHKHWPAPRKVTVEYSNAIDLLQICSDENHHYWEV